MQCFYPAGTNGGVIKPQPRLKQYGKTFKLFKNICNASVTGLWDMWLTNVFHFEMKRAVGPILKSTSVTWRQHRYEYDFIMVFMKIYGAKLIF